MCYRFYIGCKMEKVWSEESCRQHCTNGQYFCSTDTEVMHALNRALSIELSKQ